MRPPMIKTLLRKVVDSVEAFFSSSFFFSHRKEIDIFPDGRSDGSAGFALPTPNNLRVNGV